MADRHLSRVPPENLETYTLIYSIEITLRELIIEQLKGIEGYDWYRRRLPPDVLKKYKDGRKKEKATTWTSFVHHDPLYYVDFPDLAKILDTGANWRDGFSHLMGNKDVWLGSLKSLEEIRNKIAHNRRAPNTDVSIARGIHNKLVTALGADSVENLVSRCSSAPDAKGMLHDLLEELGAGYAACCGYEMVEPRTAWSRIKSSGWLYVLSMDNDIEPVNEFFRLIDEYEALPASIPSYKIDRWKAAHELQAAKQRAEVVINNLLSEV